MFVPGKPFQISIDWNSRLLGPFIIYEENEVLWILPQLSIYFISVDQSVSDIYWCLIYIYGPEETITDIYVCSDSMGSSYIEVYGRQQTKVSQKTLSCFVEKWTKRIKNERRKKFQSVCFWHRDNGSKCISSNNVCLITVAQATFVIRTLIK